MRAKLIHVSLNSMARGLKLAGKPVVCHLQRSRGHDCDCCHVIVTADVIAYQCRSALLNYIELCCVLFWKQEDRHSCVLCGQLGRTSRFTCVQSGATSLVYRDNKGTLAEHLIRDAESKIAQHRGLRPPPKSMAQRVTQRRCCAAVNLNI